MGPKLQTQQNALYRNATSYIEHILEATSHKAAAVRPPPAISKTVLIRRTRHTGKVRANSEATFSYGPLNVDEQMLDDQLEFIFIDTACSQDLPEVMDERDEW